MYILRFTSENILLKLTFDVLEINERNIQCIFTVYILGIITGIKYATNAQRPYFLLWRRFEGLSAALLPISG